MVIDKMVKIVGISLVLFAITISINPFNHEIKENNDEWNKEYGSKTSAFVDGIVTDDGIILLGNIMNDDVWKPWLVKIDKNGNEIWSKVYERNLQAEEVGESIAYAEDGFVIGGYTGTYAGTDCWIIKIDKNGNEIWNRTYDYSTKDYGLKIIATKDGGYAMVGKTYNKSADILVIKTDKDGNIQWEKTFGGKYTEHGNSILETEDGYLISGITYSYETHGGWDAWLIKIDKEGNEIWNKTYGWQEFEIDARIAEAGNGYILYGVTEYSPRGGAYIIKIDKNGNEIWKKGYGGRFARFCNGKKIEGGYILAGSTDAFAVGRSDAWVLKIDEEGNEIWNKSFGTRSRDIAFAIEILDESHYIIIGEKDHETHTTVDSRGWVVKFADYFPPKVEIVKPKNYFYIFDREIFPTQIPMILGDITVKCNASDPMNIIDRVEFYLLLEDVWYEYKPRAIDYSPPYEWKWRFGIGFYEVTVGAYYGNAGAVAVDKIELYIINPFPPASSFASLHK